MAAYEIAMLFDYELIDCGDQRRLESFSGVIVNRPAPQALWPKNKNLKQWQHAKAYYQRPESGQGQWRDISNLPKEWRLSLDNINLDLKPSANNQLGIFPEQLVNWQWIKDKLQNVKRPVSVLNTFAYTGAASLVASAASEQVKVCHVDGAKAAVTWARHNAKLSGLEERPIRWIVDDVMTFVQREIKRGNKYDAIILDPPAFGRGPKGTWKIERDLATLLTAVKSLISKNPLFIVLSCHAPELTKKHLIEFLEPLAPSFKEKPRAFQLTIKSKTGQDLPSGLCGRIE